MPIIYSFLGIVTIAAISIVVASIFVGFGYLINRFIIQRGDFEFDFMENLISGYAYIIGIPTLIYAGYIFGNYLYGHLF
jgi:hypothetical protein